MDYTTPGLPVHHQLLEFTQTHVHWVTDAIQPSHPLLFPSSPAFNLSQHQGLFQWVSSLHQMAKVLEFQLQHQSFQWMFRTDFLLTGWIFLQSKGLSRVFSNTTVQKHQFFGIQLSLQYNPHIHTWLLEKLSKALPTRARLSFSWSFALGGASLTAKSVKNLPAMEETWVWFLDQEDPLEKG